MFVHFKSNMGQICSVLRVPHIADAIFQTCSINDRCNLYLALQNTVDDETLFQFMEILFGLQRKLFLYQIDAIKHIGAYSSCMINHEAGLGKTYGIVGYLSTVALYTKPCNWLPTLIICPVNVTNVWIKELECSFLKNRIVLMTTKEHSGVITNASVVITNYSSFMDKTLAQNTYKWKLFSTIWGSMVCDEAHHIRNTSTNTSKHIVRLNRKSTILITATPFHNNISEESKMYSNLMSQTSRGVSIKFNQNVHCTQKFKALIHTVKHDDIFPPSQFHYLELNEVEYEIYNIYHYKGSQMSLAIRHLQRQSVVGNPHLITKYQKCILGIYIRLQQACIHVALCKDVELTDQVPMPELDNRLSTLTQDYTSSKFKKMYELYAAIPKEDSVVIVSHYTSVLKLAVSYMCTVVPDMEYLCFTGETKNKDFILSQFNGDNNTKQKVLFLSAKAGGEGIDLTRANHMIVLDLDWNPQTFTQLKHRICRINQRKMTHSHVILTNTGLELAKERVRKYKDECARRVVKGLKRQMEPSRDIFNSPSVEKQPKISTILKVVK